MATNSKYNRGKLKKQFFTSNFTSVKGFFENITGGYNAHITKYTKGRGMEKKKISQQSFEKAKEEIIEETKEEIKEYYKPSIKELSEMHKAVMNLLKGELKIMIENAHDNKINSMYKMNNIREIVKTEKGEPTSGSRIDGEVGGDIKVSFDSEVEELFKK